MSRFQVPRLDHCIWRARINHLCKSGLCMLLFWEYIYTESWLKNEIKYIWWVWCSLRRMLLHISCTTEMERESNWGGDEGRRVNTNITFCTFVMDNYYPNYDLLIRECFWNNIFKLLVKSTYCFLFGLLYGITYFIMNREVSPLELSRKHATLG